MSKRRLRKKSLNSYLMDCGFWYFLSYFLGDMGKIKICEVNQWIALDAWCTCFTSS